MTKICGFKPVTESRNHHVHWAMLDDFNLAPMPKDGVKTTTSCGLLRIILCLMPIPPIYFVCLFLSIKGTF